MGQIKSKETMEIIATNDEHFRAPDPDCVSDDDSGDDLSNSLSGDISNSLYTINTITGDYVEVDYDERTETIIAEASEIFCYGEFKNRDGIGIITKNEAEHLAWMENPKLLFKGNSGSYIITPDNGFSYISLNGIVLDLDVRVLEVVGVTDESYQDVIICMITELEIIRASMRTSEILARFDHNIPNVRDYILVDSWIGNHCVLYRSGTIIKLITLGLDVETIPFKSIGNVEIFERCQRVMYIDTKTRTHFDVDHTQASFINEKLDECGHIAIMRSIAKMYPKNGNLIVCMNGSNMELEDFEDNHLPARPRARSKSARS